MHDILLLLQTDLALRFELTGGFIKNAILSALSIAVSRDGDSPLVHQKDLLQGANLQLRGRLRMKVSTRVTKIYLLKYSIMCTALNIIFSPPPLQDFDRRVVPTAGLDEVVVDDTVLRQLKEIVQFEKAR